MPRTSTEIREKLVTRTIITNKIKAMIVDKETREITEETFTLPDGIKPEKIALFVTKQLPENKIFATVLETIAEEKLYGMPESVFIANAKELPPRTSKD